MKSLRIVLIVAAAALLALPAVFGMLTEAKVRERVDSLDDHDTLAVTLESYDRGWLTSRALISIAARPASDAAAAAGLRTGPAGPGPSAGTRSADGGGAPQPRGTVLARPLDVVVELHHGPVSLRDGVFFGASDLLARPARADERGASGRTAPLEFEFRGRATFGGELRFAATLPPIEALPVEEGKLSLSGGSIAGTVAGQRLTAEGTAASLEWANGTAALVLEGIRAKADNEVLPSYLLPGTLEITVDRATVDRRTKDAPSALLDAAGIALRSDVRLDAAGGLLDGAVTLLVASARTAGDSRIADARLDSAVASIDPAALEAYYEASRRLDAADVPSRRRLEELEPSIERLLASGPSIAIRTLRFDMNGEPFEATLEVDAVPDALPGTGAPLDLRNRGFWLDVLEGRLELTAAKRLVERAAVAVAKSRLAAEFMRGSAVSSEALAPMAEAQASFALAMLAAQGLVEETESRYSVDLRLGGGNVTVNGNPLPLALR